jgi:hypothetical protein
MNLAAGVLLIGGGTLMLWRRRSFAKGAVWYNHQVARMLPWLYYGPGKVWLSEAFQRAGIAVMGVFAIVLGGLFVVVRSN